MTRLRYPIFDRGRARRPAIAGAVIVAALLCMSLSGAALGAGFAIYEQGAKALGMGGAFAAVADDPSALFYNPAGLARISGKQLYLGPSLIIVPARDFGGANPNPGFGVTAESTSDVFFPPNAYYAHPVNERLSMGLFLNAPFGLKVEWEDPEAFAGRYISTLAKITPVFFGGSLAYEVNEQFLVGGGVTLVHSKVDLERFLNTTLVGIDHGPVFDVGKVTLEGSNDIAAGFSAGVLIAPNGPWSIGFGYRHGVEVDYEGDAKFEQISTGNAELDALAAANLPADQAISATIEFPAQWSLGIATTAIENWTFAFDLNWTNWAAFERLIIDFADDADLQLDRAEDWEDVFNYRAGAEWRVNERWAIRFGGYFDENPQPDKSVSPVLPDADRVGVTFGLGRTFDRWTIDAYNLAVIFDERSTNGASQDDFNGSYQGFANIIGFNLGYRF